MSDLLAPMMLVCLVMVLLAGFPVAFSLAAVAGAFGAAGVLAGRFNTAYLAGMVFRVEGTFNNDNLLAIPLLVCMGMLLERTGIAEKMFIALNRLFGRRPGGLAYTTIIVGAGLSAVTGFVSASVIAIGLIALPAMLQARYDTRLASGVVTAAGTLAQVLPPSLVLIVLAEQMEVSLVDIYRGALLPGAALVGAYLAYVSLATWRRPGLAPPAASPGDDSANVWERWGKAALAAGLPLGLMVLVLASIFLGVATPSEGGAFGVTGTLLLGLATRTLNSRNLRQALEASGILCSGIVFLLLGASFFTLVFRGLDGDIWVQGLFHDLPAGPTGFVVFVNVMMFLLAFVLDFFEIAFIVIPLIAPIARALGIDMVWLTVLLAVNLQTSFMHPPFGIALYNLKSIAPRVIRTADIYLGALPFVAIQILLLILLIAVPQIATSPAAKPADVGDIKIEIPAPPN